MIFDFDKIPFERARSMLLGTGDRMNQSRGPVVDKLTRIAIDMGPDRFRESVIRKMLRKLNIQDLVPAVYADYREIVQEGFRFFLFRLSLDRFLEIAADQLLLEPDASPAQRVFRMVQSVPTLHKLGQTLARNRNIDPVLRKWLIGLENGCYGADIKTIRKMILKEVRNYSIPLKIQVDPEILSEASVGAVVGFTWTAPDNGRSRRGAFKVLKPGVREKLEEEFILLDDLALHFHRRRHRCPLQKFTFVETFGDIRSALTEEIDLSGEQTRLKRAGRFYAPGDAVSIPEVLPFSTDQLTAMTMMPGGKITAPSAGIEDRRHLARTLFRTMIWEPIFSLEDETPFHGDPHAGNLFAAAQDGQPPKPVLLDWSLSGTLTRFHRAGLVRLMMHVLADDEEGMLQAVDSLSPEEPDDSPDPGGRRLEIIRRIRKHPDYARSRSIERAFYLIDRAALEGIRFPRNLLLFRKAFFTLDGVLRELDPEFTMAGYAVPLLKALVWEELPDRWAAELVPRPDRAEKYRSLISNRELQAFMVDFMMGRVDRWIDSRSELMAKSAVLVFRQLTALYSTSAMCISREGASA
jgi:ubiquinone biosynthesis protein